MVSIIVPIYNVDKYIDKCITSIVNQTYRDIEIVLVNDGSTDDSEKKCLEWANRDDRIMVVSKKNEGQGIARNLGVKVCKGEYITFVDGDDWLDLLTIEKMYDAIVRTNVDIVTSNINYVEQCSSGEYTIKESNLRIKKETIIYVKDDVNLINKVRLFIWGKLYKKELFLDNNLKQPDHAFEDTAIVPLLIAKSNNIYHIEKPLYYYLRNRSGSTVNNFSSLSDMKKSLMSVNRSFISNKLFDEYYEALKNMAIGQVRFICKKGKSLTDSFNLKEYKKIQLELYEFMDKTYPEWVNFENYTVGIVGSEYLKKSVKNILIDEEQVKYYLKISEPINYEALETVGILFVDLLDDSILENEKLWEGYCEEKLAYIKRKFKYNRIVIVKSKISDSYKKNGEIIDISYNKHINKILDKKYEIWEGNLKNISSIRLSKGIVFDNKEKLHSNIINDLNENLTWDISDIILSHLEAVRSK